MTDKATKWRGDDIRRFCPSAQFVRLHVGQGWRFGLVGLCATGVHAGIVVVLVEWLSVWVHGANLVAFAVAVSFSYAGNRLWAFKSRGRVAFQFPRFVIVAALALGSSAVILALSVEVFGWSYLIGLALANVLVPIQTYSLHCIWTFRR